MNVTGRLFALTLVCGALSGCTLPRGAALQSEVLKAESSEAAGFAVYPVSRDLLPRIASWPATGGFEARKWPKHSRGAVDPIIAAGDQVVITVWESDENALLAPPSQKETVLQTMTVSGAGDIFMPYIGKIRIAGMSPGHARDTLQERLSALIPSVQVQLASTPGPKNTVSLIGGVRNAGSFPMQTRDLTVMQLISMGGGVPESIKNPQVRLVRANSYYAISLDRLYAEPDLDTTLRGGDKVFVEEDKRFFLALGAAGNENQIPFNNEQMTALDAVTLAGGLSDARADPKGVLILRQFAPEDVAPPGGNGPEDTRVIFTLDLTTADGLFSAGRFQIMPRDLVLATESPVSSTRTILGLLAASAGIAVDADKL
ncbi:MAG: polysaccharide export protein [Rhodobacteraceae bacterium]|nr:polysaccharide export protein [Paracoccaceae bacterium]MCP5342268.1 polysaccharide export protein [Paracoccaceae bacterium]